MRIQMSHLDVGWRNSNTFTACYNSVNTSKKYLVIFSLICLTVNCSAINTKISGIINAYTTVHGFSGDTITVASSIDFAVGDKVLIIQMQGATIDQSNTAGFGDITNINEAGLYEFTTICKISNANQLIVKCLKRTFNPDGMVQLIRIPVYDSAEITGIVTALPWNGSTGGVLAFECKGALTMNSGIDLRGLGFRGGALTTSAYSCSWLINVRDYHYNISSGEGAMKGEGIALYVAGKTAGRGAQANGGGGGNDHNSGGGGGANANNGGAGGERIKASAFTCGAIAPGIGGKSNTYSNIENRVFLGGGGGAGHENNAGAATAGSNGGGLVFIKAKYLMGNGNTIDVGGGGVLNNSLDGSGGGGAGGTVLLDVKDYQGALFVQANGGDGGHVDNLTTVNCNGPGGGGSGGVVWLIQDAIPSNVTIDLKGGSAGTVLSSAQGNCTVGGHNNATNGASGITLTKLSLFESNCIVPPTIQTKTICASDSLWLGGNWRSMSGIFYDTVSSGCRDSIIQTNLTVLPFKQSTINASICHMDSLVINGNSYKTSVLGAKEIFRNIGPYGCDSLVIINLTVNSVDTTITRISTSKLQSNAVSAEYQWIDCNNRKAISGEKDQTFTAIKTGNYAVKITKSNCTDTSKCYAVIIKDSVIVVPNNKILVYPNPTDGFFTVDLSEKVRNCDIQIFDISGKLIQRHNFKNSQILKLDLSASIGIYMLVVDDGAKQTVIKLLKL